MFSLPRFSVQLVMAFLWCVSKVQSEEGVNQASIISAMSCYVRGFIDKGFDKQCRRSRSSKAEPGNNSTENKEIVVS